MAMLLSGCAGIVAPPREVAPSSSSGPAAPPADLGEVKPFFIPGESFTFELSYAGIEGGRARLAVGQVAQSDGRRVVVLHGDGESSGILAIVKELSDDIVTWLDVDAGVPTRTETTSTAGKRLTVVHTKRAIGGKLAEMMVWRNARAREDGRAKTALLPSAGTQDSLSAVLALRGWRPAEAGAHARLYTLGGERLWRSEVVSEGVEVVDSALGRRRALRLAAVSKRMTGPRADDPRPPRQWRVWITDDEQRVPLRVEAQTELGAIVVQLTSYERPD